MVAPRQPRLEASGNPTLQRSEDAVRRALSDMHQDVTRLDASDIAYTPSSAASWVAPLPTTVQSALDRLAAAAGVVPVP